MLQRRRRNRSRSPRCGRRSARNLNPIVRWESASQRQLHLRPLLVIAEWLREHPVKAQFLRFAELLYADCHFVMSGFRLRAIGTEESVPPRKIESEVAVSLAPQCRMMNAVHVESNQ